MCMSGEQKPIDELEEHGLLGLKHSVHEPTPMPQQQMDQAMQACIEACLDRRAK